MGTLVGYIIQYYQISKSIIQYCVVPSNYVAHYGFHMIFVWLQHYNRMICKLNKNRVFDGYQIYWKYKDLSTYV